MSFYKQTHNKTKVALPKPKTQSLNREAKRARDSINPKLFYEILKGIGQTSYIQQRDTLVFMLLWSLGLRVNELSHFYFNNWIELETEKKTTLFEPKLNQSKEVFISKENQKDFKDLSWAKDWFQTHADAPLLRTLNGTTLSSKYVLTYFNDLLKPYGEKYNLKIRTHSFRISLITELLKNSDSNVVKDIMGHKDLNTTLRYNRGTTPNKKKFEALNKTRK